MKNNIAVYDASFIQLAIKYDTRFLTTTLHLMNVEGVKSHIVNLDEWCYCISDTGSFKLSDPTSTMGNPPYKTLLFKIYLNLITIMVSFRPISH